MSRMSRSVQMARIHGNDTKPELVLRRALWHRGLRYRLRTRIRSVRPDLVFVGPRVCVFIDGCFWHGCPHHYVRPRIRHDFWRGKLRDNNDRDRRQTLDLEAHGWTVIRVWEHEIEEELDHTVEIIEAAVDGRRVESRQWRVVSVEPLDEGDRERRHFELLRQPSTTLTYEGPRNSRSGRLLCPGLGSDRSHLA